MQETKKTKEKQKAGINRDKERTKGRKRRKLRKEREKKRLWIEKMIWIERRANHFKVAAEKKDIAQEKRKHEREGI